MVDPSWRRISGMSLEDDGTLAVVWMALDRASDVIHLYDVAVFRREVLAVISEGINARGRWIPMAWESKAKDMADRLLDRGCNMIPEPIKETQAGAEVSARDVWERMRTKRFRADKRLAEWIDESRGFYRQDSQVPLEGHPLMSATRHAVERLNYARRQAAARESGGTYPQIAIV